MRSHIARPAYAARISLDDQQITVQARRVDRLNKKKRGGKLHVVPTQTAPTGVRDVCASVSASASECVQITTLG
jgi:hypothetical protein